MSWEEMRKHKEDALRNKIAAEMEADILRKAGFKAAKDGNVRYESEVLTARMVIDAMMQANNIDIGDRSIAKEAERGKIITTTFKRKSK